MHAQMIYEYRWFVKSTIEVPSLAADLDSCGDAVSAPLPNALPDQLSAFWNQWSANGSSLNAGTSTQPADR